MIECVTAAYLEDVRICKKASSVNIQEMMRTKRININRETTGSLNQLLGPSIENKNMFKGPFSKAMQFNVEDTKTGRVYLNTRNIDKGILK